MPEFSETELKEIAMKFPCRVELFHSNVCHGVEREWPIRMFHRSTYRDLLPKQKRLLTSTMVRNAIQLYDKYVNEERLRNRRKRHTNRALAPYLQERFLKHRFNRIKALGDITEADASSNLNESVKTVIDGSQTSTLPTVQQQNQEIRNEEIPSPEFESEIDDSYDDDDDEFESCESFVEEDDKDEVQQHETRHNESLFTPKQNSRPKYNTTVPKSIIAQTNLFDNEPEISVVDMFDDGLSDGYPGHSQFKTCTGTFLNITKTVSFEKCEISDNSDDESVLIIDERFNDCQTQNSEIETVAIAHQSNDRIDFIEFSTPRINSTEFLPINTINIRKLSASLDESLELMFNSN